MQRHSRTRLDARGGGLAQLGGHSGGLFAVKACCPARDRSLDRFVPAVRRGVRVISRLYDFTVTRKRLLRSLTSSPDHGVSRCPSSSSSNPRRAAPLGTRRTGVAEPSSASTRMSTTRPRIRVSMGESWWVSINRTCPSASRQRRQPRSTTSLRSIAGPQHSCSQSPTSTVTFKGAPSVARVCTLAEPKLVPVSRSLTGPDRRPPRTAAVEVIIGTGCPEVLCREGVGCLSGPCRGPRGWSFLV